MSNTKAHKSDTMVHNTRLAGMTINALSALPKFSEPSRCNQKHKTMYRATPTMRIIFNGANMFGEHDAGVTTVLWQVTSLEPRLGRFTLCGRGNIRLPKLPRRLVVDEGNVSGCEHLVAT